MGFGINVNGDPQVSIVAIIFAIGFLLLLKGILDTKCIQEMHGQSVSYAKFLHTIISSLSSAVFKHQEGSCQIVWLPDASVVYLKGKHIALFIVAILILVAGVLFTVVLLLWQWLLRHQDKKIFLWVKYQKLCYFIELYHAPYSFKHLFTYLRRMMVTTDLVTLLFTSHG